MEDRARLLRGLAVEERRIEVAGIGTTVLEGGDGPPLVLLHGGIECGGAYWAPVIPRLAGDWLDAFTAYTRSRAQVPHVKRTMRYLIGTCTKQVHGQIHVPTTLLWGAKDRFVPLALAEEASARLGWSLQVIDDAGHVPHIEQPDAFLEEVTRTRS